MCTALYSLVLILFRVSHTAQNYTRSGARVAPALRSAIDNTYVYRTAHCGTPGCGRGGLGTRGEYTVQLYREKGYKGGTAGRLAAVPLCQK